MAKKKRKNSNYHNGRIYKFKDMWGIPSGASKFFDPHYDDVFKKEHPILYFLTVVGIVVLVCVGPFIFLGLCGAMDLQFDHPIAVINVLKFIIWIIGFISSFGISIGLNNLFMVLHRQYLGHYLTLISFGIGIGGMIITIPLLCIF